jgi:hypothetical protein
MASRGKKLLFIVAISFAKRNASETMDDGVG